MFCLWRAPRCPPHALFRARLKFAGLLRRQALRSHGQARAHGGLQGELPLEREESRAEGRQAGSSSWVCVRACVSPPCRLPARRRRELGGPHPTRAHTWTLNLQGLSSALESARGWLWCSRCFAAFPSAARQCAASIAEKCASQDQLSGPRFMWTAAAGGFSLWEPERGVGGQRCRPLPPGWPVTQLLGLQSEK